MQSLENVSVERFQKQKTQKSWLTHGQCTETTEYKFLAIFFRLLLQRNNGLREIFFLKNGADRNNLQEGSSRIFL